MSNNEQELKKLESEMDRIESDSLSFPYDPLGNAIDTAIQSHIEEDGFQEEVVDYETVEMINKIQKSLDVIEKEANHLGSISHMAEGERSILRHYFNQPRIWYSTTEEGATEKHPFKEPEHAQLLWGGRHTDRHKNWKTYKDRHNEHDNQSTWYSHWTPRHVDTPPPFED